MRTPPKLEIRRRHLPHWTLENATYFITFRIQKDKLSSEERGIVLEHVKSGHEEYYLLIAVVVMPDHVHLLLQPNEGVTLSRIMKGIKGVSANKINKQRKTNGSLWQDESFDRIIRDEKELDEKLHYMLNNPHKSGLVENAWDYPFWFYNEQQ